MSLIDEESVEKKTKSLRYGRESQLKNTVISFSKEVEQFLSLTKNLFHWIVI